MFLLPTHSDEEPYLYNITSSAYQTNNPQIAADSKETSNPDSIM